MPLFIPRDGPRILYVHVPKTGGTSVTLYLEKRFGTALMANRTTRDVIGNAYRRRGFISPPGHFTAEDLTEFASDQIDYCFATVRDPLTRIISEYGFQMPSARHRLGFSSWLRVMLSAAKGDPRIYNNHLRPQSDLVPEGADVFRLEDGFDSLVQKLDIIAGGSSDAEIDQLNGSSVPDGLLKIHREDIEAISDYYAVDYERFGYKQPAVYGFPKDGLSLARSAFGAVAGRAAIIKQRRTWLS